METTALAVYIDLENLPLGVDFDRLMDMAASETARHVFAVKAVYGSAAALPKQYRSSSSTTTSRSWKRPTSSRRRTGRT